MRERAGHHQTGSHMFLIPALVLAAAWWIAELRAKPVIRRVLGVLLVALLVVNITYVRGSERLSANHYFTSAAEDLLAVSLQQLQEGRSDAVVREWARARARFGATYETRGGFAEVVREAVDGMRNR